MSRSRLWRGTCAADLTLVANRPVNVAGESDALPHQLTRRTVTVTPVTLEARS